MTVPSTQFWGGDVYLSTAFPLNSDGSLQAPDSDPYEGLEVDGARTFDLTPAEGSYLVNVGNGRLRDTIYRAPREASRAELRVGYAQLDVIAALSGVQTYQVAEAIGIGRLTNLQGSEPDVALHLMQSGHDENGLTRYLNYIIPKGKCIPIDSPFNDNPLEVRYTVTISNSRKEVWGETYTLARHHFTETGYLTFITTSRGKIAAWLADGYLDTFLLPTAKPATAVEKLSVWNWNDGTEYTGAGISKSLTQFTVGAPPETDDIIVAFYEY